MKKILITLILFLLCGCKDPMDVPKETIDTMNTAKYNTAITSTQEYLRQAEVKYTSDMMYGQEKECYQVTEINVSTSAISGKVCSEANSFVAHDITFDEYICNGKMNDIKCEEVK